MWRFASFKAPSQASVPELVRYTLNILGSVLDRSLESCTGCSWINSPYTITWVYLFNCFFIALVTFGCWWPKLLAETPATKSKYFLPLIS